MTHQLVELGLEHVGTLIGQHPSLTSVFVDLLERVAFSATDSRGRQAFVKVDKEQPWYTRSSGTDRR